MIDVNTMCIIDAPDACQYADAWTPDFTDDEVHEFALNSYMTVYAPDRTLLPDSHPTPPEFLGLMLL